MWTHLFGVQFHFMLSLWEKLDVICPINLLCNDSNLISNRQLKNAKKLQKKDQFK